MGVQTQRMLPLGVEKRQGTLALFGAAADRVHGAPTCARGAAGEEAANAADSDSAASAATGSDAPAPSARARRLDGPT